MLSQYLQIMNVGLRPVLSLISPLLPAHLCYSCNTFLQKRHFSTKGEDHLMARKRVERNISFDDVRKVYYVSMDLGKNSEGKRVKQYRTFPNLTSARTGLREFYADRDKLLHPPKQEQTLRQWLDYWMENIIRPNRAETTVYAYQKIIDNHLDPLLGAVPLSKLSPKQIQEYYQTMTRTEGLSSNTIRRHHDLLSAALRMAVRPGYAPGQSHGAGGAAPPQAPRGLLLYPGEPEGALPAGRRATGWRWWSRSPLGWVCGGRRSAA